MTSLRGTSGPTKKAGTGPKKKTKRRRGGVPDAAKRGEMLAMSSAEVFELASEDGAGDRLEELEATGGDPEAWDPVEEYTRDPLFDDTDPSERTRERSHWDMGDRPVDDRSAEQTVGRAEALLRETTPGSHELVFTVGSAGYGHLPERQRLLEEICKEIAVRQNKYLLSEDRADLEPLTKADLEAATSADASTITRLVTGISLELPSGNVVMMEDLLQDPTEARIRFIASLLRNLDQVERRADGSIGETGLASKQEIVEKVQARFGKRGNSDSSIRGICSKERQIPLNTRERSRYYEEGRDWWTWS